MSSLPFHTIEIIPGTTLPVQKDRIFVGALTVANVIGSGAGLPVVTAVANLQLPAAYEVLATPNQDAVAFVSGKTTTGFNVTLNPRLAANTLAVGTIDLFIYA